jgi:thymidylate synthase ThyX
MVLAEFNTHRVFSRNSASSRAIPVEKMIQMVSNNGFVPAYWGKNQKGMQAEEELSEQEAKLAESEWMLATSQAIKSAKMLLEIGVHKQLANRLLEPFMWHTVLVSATEWGNFFALRCAEAAAPEIRNIALLARELYETHQPTLVGIGEYHLPLFFEEDWDKLAEQYDDYQLKLMTAKQISIARCARVSYLTHDGKRDFVADLTLFARLRGAPHLSPFEHVATPAPSKKFYGNYRGWVQDRKTIHNEHDASIGLV